MKELNAEKVDRHIEVLDGVRAAAVGLVAWFHFWQQSWLTPGNAWIEGFVRYGFVFVDMLILLSAFCNFYPYARAILLEEPWPDTKRFYLKRAVRILPSYYLSLLVMAAVMLAEGRLVIDGFFWKDVIAHVTCTGALFPDTYLGSNFSGVLWTVQIEVLYYIMMPWIAKLFRRAPVLTCGLLWGCGFFSARYLLCEKADEIQAYVNHMATFAGCYADGMLLCMLYITLKGSDLENGYTRLAATGAAVCCVLYTGRMVRPMGEGGLQLIQLRQRFELSLVFSCFLLALPFACRGLQCLFASRVMRFFASISYNLYLWHQYIAVKCKEYRIPWWEGDTPPNITGDRVWMWKYQILIIMLSLAVALVMTYGVERKAARFFLKK